jgi:hypothetical protein
MTIGVCVKNSLIIFISNESIQQKTALWLVFQQGKKRSRDESEPSSVRQVVRTDE